VTATGTRRQPPPGDDELDEDSGPLLSRKVLGTGLALGVTLTMLLYWGGWHPRFGGIPAVLGYLVAFMFVILAEVAAATVLAELVRRHGKRAALASARAAGRGGRAARRRADQWAGPRWQIRQGDTPPAAAVITPPADAAPLAPPAPPPGAGLVPVPVSPASPATANGGQPAMTAGNPPVRVRSKLPDSVKEGAPAEWQAVASSMSDFEPDSDEAYLEWAGGLVAGLATAGEAVADVYDTCVENVRLDPAAMASLHDVADAFADAATAAAYARQKFASHYSEVREFVAAGGVLPADGDWLTGEGEA
jgi:hypothetical protein